MRIINETTYEKNKPIDERNMKGEYRRNED